MKFFAQPKEMYIGPEWQLHKMGVCVCDNPVHIQANDSFMK